MNRMDEAVGVFPRIVAIVLEPSLNDRAESALSESLPACRNSGRSGHDVELDGFERDVFQDFIDANKSCYWNPQLMETFRFIRFAGYLVEPYTLLVSSKRNIYLDNIISAWSRRALISPPGYTILRLGELNQLSIQSDRRRTFALLSEAVCLTISDCNRLNVAATFDEIMTRLSQYYPAMYHPNESQVYQMLDCLHREGTLSHTGIGYRVEPPNQYAPKVTAYDKGLLDMAVGGSNGFQPVNQLINGSAGGATGWHQSQSINLITAPGWSQNIPAKKEPRRVHRMTDGSSKHEQNLPASQIQAMKTGHKGTPMYVKLRRSFSLLGKKKRICGTAVGCSNECGPHPCKEPEIGELEEDSFFPNQLSWRNNLNLKHDMKNNEDELGTTDVWTDNLLYEHGLTNKVNITPAAIEMDCPLPSTASLEPFDEMVPNNNAIRVPVACMQSQSSGPRVSSGSEDQDEIPMKRVKRYRKYRKVQSRRLSRVFQKYRAWKEQLIELGSGVDM